MVFVNTSCSKRKGPKNLTPTNFTVYKKTFTILADGVRNSSTSTPWPKTWQDFWNDIGSTAVGKGREFIKWAEEKYGINANALTDVQLTNGEQVDLGDFVYSPYLPSPTELGFRLMTETTQKRAKFYRNTIVREAAFVIQVKADYQSTGTLKVAMPSGALIFMGTYLIDTTKECGFSSDADVITFTPKPYAEWIGEMASLNYELMSNKYGAGELIGLAIETPFFFRLSASLFFLPTTNGP